jgi:hypothetical protein
MVASIAAMVEVLVINVTSRTSIVWSGIIGVIPRNMPMAVPLAREFGSPCSLVNLR